MGVSVIAQLSQKLKNKGIKVVCSIGHVNYMIGYKEKEVDREEDMDLD